MKRYKILDWYVHQGHQHQLFKAPHDFYLVAADGTLPKWNKDHRPLGGNVKLITEKQALRMGFDIVMLRTPIPRQRYMNFIKRGAAPIAVIQTVDPVKFPSVVKNIVWNSKVAMDKRKGFFKGRKEYFIVHGYDPKEFRPFDIEKNNRVLTVANHFKQRSHIMGFDIWKYIRDSTNKCDVVGSRNKKIKGSLPHRGSFSELLETYSLYSVYLNPTRLSAMPRSRAEAAMCGMPIVSTMNYDFKNFFKPNKHALLSNDKDMLLRYVNKLLNSEQMRLDYGSIAREQAIKHFHIKDYLSKYQEVFDQAMADR